jgi:AcrR family transcriptional regulator
VNDVNIGAVPTTAAPRAYHHGDLRRALLEAATELASGGGVAGVVLREAARKVGVSPSAAYRHFPSREGLLAAVGGEARGRLVTRMLAAPTGDARAHFQATGRAYIEFALDEPGLFEVAFRPCPPELYLPEDPSPYHVLSAALDALERDGDLAVPRVGAEEPAWAAVHGAAVLLGERMIPPSERARVIDATLAMVGDGLLRPEPAGRARTLRR